MREDDEGWEKTRDKPALLCAPARDKTRLFSLEVAATPDDDEHYVYAIAL